LTALDSALRNKAGIVILILPQNDKQNQTQYANFKAVMDKNGMDSLCLCKTKLKQKHDKLDPYSPTSNMANYAYNVGMKLNIRHGNANHSLAGNHFDILPKGANGNHDTLILGADVIHPGVSSIDGTQSIAALVGSVDGRYAKYLGSARMQKYNKTARSIEVIDNTNRRAMARERLDAWKRENGRYPVNIVYYLDGVGDSQFSQVYEKEVAMIREAHNDSVKGTAQSKSKVKVTTMVVVKRHNVRLYPSASGDMINTGNCLPGPVVDSGITHPYNFDFFLISHEGAPRNHARIALRCPPKRDGLQRNRYSRLDA
jgi:eukaryotic translation initiation factor 2C